RAYDAFCSRFNLEPARAIFFEDMERNLKPAHAMGFTTVLVRSDAEWAGNEPEGARPASLGDELGAHIDYVTDHLTDFLRAATPAPA
ncbi:MAG: HAD-IA family hydrolase, partial [Pseudomonadota bacterium]